MKSKLAKLYNRFINWHYRLDIAVAELKIRYEDIDKATYALNDIKKKINPKTDIIIKLSKQLDDRINAK